MPYTVLIESVASTHYVFDPKFTYACIFVTAGLKLRMVLRQALFTSSTVILNVKVVSKFTPELGAVVAVTVTAYVPTSATFVVWIWKVFET